jgi:hypothetical protein
MELAELRKIAEELKVPVESLNKYNRRLLADYLAKGEPKKESAKKPK